MPGGQTWIALICLAVRWVADPAQGQQADRTADTSSVRADDNPETLPSSTEQGRTPLDEAFDWRAWSLEKREEALKATKFTINARTYYMDRRNFDGSESEAWTIGGSASLKTGYFLDHAAFGLTGCTSQPLYGPDGKDGTKLLAPGQEPYSVLGELYTDIRIVDGLNLYAGRKGFDTPFINRNDTRMTPNTFEAVVLQGRAELGDGCGTLKYGVGYFDQIKERDSDDFVSMAIDAGAKVERGVCTAGALYQIGKFSFGAIDYYCADVINIGYVEAKAELPFWDAHTLRLAAQYADQRSVGDNLLLGEGFAARQLGFKAEVPVGKALITAAYTTATGNTNMQSPWSGYPGYTSVQGDDFNRAGEQALMLRVGYEFSCLDGLSAYALGVFGTAPDQTGQYRRNEQDLNLQWAPPEGCLKGLALRLRYAIVEQHGGDVQNLTDLRVICNYTYLF